MPEFVKNGPDIPVELMRLLDEKKVVFFCGAGISMGTGLPSFGELVNQVYEELSESPSKYEARILKAKQYDKVLGSLEGRIIRGAMREAVAKILSKPVVGSLEVHQDLLTLAQSGGDGFRLVTTNFDNRFSETGNLPGKRIASAPLLPLPKHSDWNSVVYLHGRIDPDLPTDQMVLTSADFGRAYLTERWASRFITELFRSFTVVFVGYSLDDPVMAYMVDALAAERSRGQMFQQAYAFAGYVGGRVAKAQALEAWRQKNVEPLPFLLNKDNARRYERLNRTLTEWANAQRDPISYRSRKVQDGLRTLPADVSDQEVQRVCWALLNPTVAEGLARHLSPSSMSERKKLAAWIDCFDKYGLLSLHEGKSDRPVGIVSASPYRQSTFSSITRNIAFWIAKHCHFPEVLGWVVSKGGVMDPMFRDMVRRSLRESGEDSKTILDVEAKLRLLWMVLIYEGEHDVEASLWWADLYEAAKTEPEREIIERSYVEGLRPRLVVKPGESSRKRFSRLYSEGSEEAPSGVEAAAHFAIELGDEDYRLLPRRFKSWDEILARNAFRINEHLRAALKLVPLDEDGYSDPAFYRRTIEARSDERVRGDWTILIDHVRDSYFALKREGKGFERVLLESWLASREILFRRLALYVLAEDDAVPPELALPILLEAGGLWSWELKRESLVFLRKAGARFPEGMLKTVLLAIHRGPPEEKRPNLTDEENAARRKSQIGLRLRKLVEAGVDLSDEDAMLAEETKPSFYPATPEREEFTVWTSAVRTGEAWPESVPPPRATLAELLVASKAEGFEDIFDGLARNRPGHACALLKALAKNAVWSPRLWDRFLWRAEAMLRESKYTKSVGWHVLPFLSQVPNDVLGQIHRSAASFLSDVAKVLPLEDEDRFAEMWYRVWHIAPGDTDTSREEVLTQALNSTVGQLADASLERMWLRNPERESGIAEPVKGYLSAICRSDKGLLGRAYLASRLPNLFSIDPDWTKENLLPFFKWETSAEALSIWEAYSWSASAGPNLFSEIKPDFIKALARYAELGEQKSNLIALFVSVCLEAPDVLSADEKRKIMKSFGVEALSDVLEFCRRLLQVDEAVAANVWREKIAPWLAQYWPKATSKNNADTSGAMVAAIMLTGDALPEAFEWAKKYIGPAKVNSAAFLGDYEERVEKFPEVVLRMLRKVIDFNSEDPWQKRIARKVLDAVSKSAPQLIADADFISLSNFASR